MSTLKNRVYVISSIMLAGVLVSLGSAYNWISRKIDHSTEESFQHLPQERIQILTALNSAIATIEPNIGVCPELLAATDATAQKLQRILDVPDLKLSARHFAEAYQLQRKEVAAVECVVLAKKLRALVNAGHLPELLGRQANVRYLQPIARAAFSTPNPWWGLPGTITVQDGRHLDLGGATDGVQFEQLYGKLDGVIGADLPAMLSASLLAPLTRQPSAERVEVFGRSWPVGNSARLTLDPALQRAITDAANCEVGSVNCDRWDGRAKKPRAGMVGFVVIDAGDHGGGRILALGGTASNCVLKQLSKPTVIATDAKGLRFVPVFRDGETDCPQFPNHESPQFQQRMLVRDGIAWMPQPAQSIPFAMFFVGSGNKPMIIAAGIRTQQITRKNAAYWTCTLAKSRDCHSEVDAPGNQRSIQDLAINQATEWHQVLVDAGLLPQVAQPGHPYYFATESQLADVVTGGKSQAQQVLSEISFPDLTKNVLAADRYHFATDAERTQPSFMVSAALASAAIGSADVKSSIVGMASWWYAIAQNAKGKITMPAVHMATTQTPVPSIDRPIFKDPMQARLLLELLGQAHISGTVASACQKEFKSECSQLKLASKTGSADFVRCRKAGQHPCQEWTIKVDPDAKRTDALPSKVFGSLFTNSAGHPYVVATMALRSRSAGGGLDSTNAAAELGMVITRHLETSPPGDAK